MSCKKGTKFKVLVFVGLVMLLTMVLILSGCGSDSKPAKATGGKKGATNAKASNPQRVIPLLGAQKIHKAPKMSINAEGKEVFAGLTREQFQAKVASQLKNNDTANMQVFPGVTVEQFKAKVAADQNKSDLLWQNEIFPGVTREEMKARIAADLRNNDFKGKEVMPFPGAKITLDQMNKKVAQQQALPREKGEIFPFPTGKPTKK
jgi:hypothetical protein